jgi:hypothetical protein
MRYHMGNRECWTHVPRTKYWYHVPYRTSKRQEQAQDTGRKTAKQCYRRLTLSHTFSHRLHTPHAIILAPTRCTHRWRFPFFASSWRYRRGWFCRYPSVMVRLKRARLRELVQGKSLVFLNTRRSSLRLRFAKRNKFALLLNWNTHLYNTPLPLCVCFRTHGDADQPVLIYNARYSSFQSENSVRRRRLAFAVSVGKLAPRDSALWSLGSDMATLVS